VPIPSSLGERGSGASCGSSGRKTCFSIILDVRAVRAGKACLAVRAGVPFPSGEGTRGAEVEALRRWAGREVRVPDVLGLLLSCRRFEAARAIPGTAPAERRGALTGAMVMGLLAAPTEGLGPVPKGRAAFGRDMEGRVGVGGGSGVSVCVCLSVCICV
jgi:hypothetical protein